MNAFQIQPRHVSANGYHFQGVVDALYKLHKQCSVYGRISTTTDHTGRVIICIRPYPEHYLSSLDKTATKPWKWQPFVETCQGRIWNALIKIHYYLEHLLAILQRYYAVVDRGVFNTVQYSTLAWDERHTIPRRSGPTSFFPTVHTISVN
jgi:hypothetical protein